MNIWTGLLFLDGAITDVALARELADDDTRRAVSDAAATTAAPSLPGTPQPHGLAVTDSLETTMKLFKGLLYLIDTDAPASPVLIDAPHYGAATAANDFGDELGNRAASRRRFGPSQQAAREDRVDAAVGGCR